MLPEKKRIHENYAKCLEKVAKGGKTPNLQSRYKNEFGSKAYKAEADRVLLSRGKPTNQKGEPVKTRYICIKDSPKIQGKPTFKKGDIITLRKVQLGLYWVGSTGIPKRTFTKHFHPLN